MYDFFNGSPKQDRPGKNEDYYRRMRERSAVSLKDAIRYDKEFANRILNYDILTASDKQNLADVIAELSYQLQDTADISRDFEEFCTEVMGSEWRDEIMRKWLQRNGNRLAEQLGMPDPFQPEGVYYISRDKTEEEEEE